VCVYVRVLSENVFPDWLSVAVNGKRSYQKQKLIQNWSPHGHTKHKCHLAGRAADHGSALFKHSLYFYFCLGNQNAAKPTPKHTHTLTQRYYKT
jgi:hypothetical protein